MLVFKHPGLHFGDMHVLNATYMEALKDYVGNAKYAIFFPINGPRSLADEIETVIMMVTCTGSQETHRLAVLPLS